MRVRLPLGAPISPHPLIGRRLAPQASNVGSSPAGDNKVRIEVVSKWKLLIVQNVVVSFAGFVEFATYVKIEEAGQGRVLGNENEKSSI